MARKHVTDQMVCEAVEQIGASRGSADDVGLIERLMSATGECKKVCRCAAWRTWARGYIEYSVSMDWPWLTEAGVEFLKRRRAESYRTNFNEWLRAVDEGRISQGSC